MREKASSRSVRTDRSAVSEALGSGIVIVIVIALAVATFIMVNKIRESSHVDDEKPEFGMSIAANEPKATVVRADEGLDWVRDLRLGGNCTPTLNGAPFPVSEGTLVLGGDVLACEWGETLVITSSQDKGNSVLFTYSF